MPRTEAGRRLMALMGLAVMGRIPPDDKKGLAWFIDAIETEAVTAALDALADPLDRLRHLIDEDGEDRSNPTWHDDAVEAFAAVLAEIKKAKAYREDTE